MTDNSQSDKPSSTPRTDAEIMYPGSGIAMVRPEFARQLERELAEAKAHVERVIKECDKLKVELHQESIIRAALQITLSEREAARPSLAVQEETAWLIESVKGRWGTGYFWRGVGEFETWGTIEKAVRFARKEDAEQVIESLLLNHKHKYGHGLDVKYEACKHVWLGGAAPLSPRATNVTTTREQIQDTLDKANDIDIALERGTTVSDDQLSIQRNLLQDLCLLALAPPLDRDAVLDVYISAILDSSLDAEDAARLQRAQLHAKAVLDDVETAPQSGSLKRDLNDNESMLAWAVDYLTDALAGARGIARATDRNAVYDKRVCDALGMKTVDPEEALNVIDGLRERLQYAEGLLEREGISLDGTRKADA